MKKMSENLGWIGTSLILLSYALLSFSLIRSDTFVYQAMNLLGALGIVVDTYYKKDRPSEILNIVWAIIAVIALVRMVLLH